MTPPFPLSAFPCSVATPPSRGGQQFGPSSRSRSIRFSCAPCPLQSGTSLSDSDALAFLAERSWGIRSRVVAFSADEMNRRHKSQPIRLKSRPHPTPATTIPATRSPGVSCRASGAHPLKRLTDWHGRPAGVRPVSIRVDMMIVEKGR